MAPAETPIPLPPTALRFMGESDERFLAQGSALATLIAGHGPRPDGLVLDIGCGYGRLAVGLMQHKTFRGRYRGFDILPRHVKWCRKYLTAFDRRFVFRHVNAHNPRYNPSGTLDPDTVRFPVESLTVDTAAAFSVFTHLYRSTIEHYLDELRRVLKPGGVAVTTWLLWDDARVPAITGETCIYPMRFTLDDDTFYSDEQDPLRAIAFRQGLVESLILDHGLRVRTVQRGSWDGVTKSSEFQDLVLIEAPATVAVRAQALARQVARRVSAAAVRLKERAAKR